MDEEEALCSPAGGGDIDLVVVFVRVLDHAGSFRDIPPAYDAGHRHLEAEGTFPPPEAPLVVLFQAASLSSFLRVSLLESQRFGLEHQGEVSTMSRKTGLIAHRLKIQPNLIALFVDPSHPVVLEIG